MVRKVIIIACLAASLLIFLDTIDIVHGLVMFLLAGIIPGTNIVLSATQMLVVMIVLTGLAIYRFAVTPLRRKLEQLAADKKRAVKSTRRLRRA
jgi:hypothetical protein